MKIVKSILKYSEIILLEITYLFMFEKIIVSQFKSKKSIINEFDLLKFHKFYFITKSLFILFFGLIYISLHMIKEKSL